MSDVSEHSDSEFYFRKKKKKRKKKEKRRWSYDKMLIDWVRSGRKGKYLALGHGVRTSLRSVRTPWPRAKYFPVRPSHSVNKYIFLLNQQIQNNTNAIFAQNLSESFTGRTNNTEEC